MVQIHCTEGMLKSIDFFHEQVLGAEEVGDLTGTLVEDPGLAPTTNLSAQQPLAATPIPVDLTPEGPACIWCIDIHAGKTPT